MRELNSIVDLVNKDVKFTRVRDVKLPNRAN